MNIVEKLQTSKANIRQISILASIPEGRIYKWSQRKSTPTGEDLEKIEHVVQLISNLSKEQIKKTVNQVANQNKDLEQALRIVTGNSSVQVTDLADDIQNIPDKNNSKKAPDGELKKPLKDDDNQLFNGEKDENNDINLPSHQNDQNMNDLIAAQRDAAKAVLLMAESQKKLVDMLERKLDSISSLEGIPKGEPLATK